MQHLPVKIAAHLLSGGGRLCILTYHRILPAPDALRPHEPTATVFDAQLRLLRAAFNILPLAEAVKQLRDGCLPRRSLAITFDDGYQDNRDIALPILQKHAVHATFFVATGFMNGGAMFNDVVVEAFRNSRRDAVRLPWDESQSFSLRTPAERLRAIETVLPIVKKLQPETRQLRVNELVAALQAPRVDTLMMRPPAVQDLRKAGMAIGGHTVNHPILSSLGDAEAAAEIADGKRTLENLLQEPIVGFAYPNGRPGRDYDERHPRMARDAGFEYAVSTEWASCRPHSECFELPRIAPTAADARGFALRVAKAYLS